MIRNTKIKMKNARKREPRDRDVEDDNKRKDRDVEDEKKLKERYDNRQSSRLNFFYHESVSKKPTRSPPGK